MMSPSFPRSTKDAVARAAGRLHRATAGASALEFAMLAPILCLVLAGIFDFGLVLYLRIGLNRMVSAGANYALVNAAEVGAQGGAALATSIAATIPVDRDVSVVVNNGPALRRVGGVVSWSGTTSAADYCYCPQLASSVLSWGAPAACGASCPDGSGAGQYVAVSASQAYSPMLGQFDGVHNGVISVQSIARVK